jgi:hypothetical protein
MTDDHERLSFNAQGLRGRLSLDDVCVTRWCDAQGIPVSEARHEVPCFAFAPEPVSWQAIIPAELRVGFPTPSSIVSEIGSSWRPGFVVVAHDDFNVRVLDETAVLATSKASGEGLCFGPRVSALAWLARENHALETVLVEDVEGWTVMALGRDGVRLYRHAREEQSHGSWREALDRAGVDTAALLAREGDDLFYFLDFAVAGPCEIEIVDESTSIYLRPQDSGAFSGVLDYSPAALGHA